MTTIRHLLENLLATASILEVRDFITYLWVFLSNAKKIVSSKSLHPADQAFMDGRDLLKVKVMGKDILLKQPDFGLVRELYGRLIYFPSPMFTPPTGSKVIDLGANAGLVSILCAKLEAVVLAVEAQSGFMEIAKDLSVLNGVEDRIRLVHALVGASTGIFSKIDLRHSSNHWVNDPPEVSMAELLNGFLRHKGETVHLLKMDIEGSEFDLFEKDISWLDKVRHISMEVHPDFGDVTVIRDRISRAGFLCDLVPSWREKGIPTRYPGFLFASRNA